VNAKRRSRTAIRFPLEAPIVFWWADASGIEKRGEGRTRDINETGVFVLASVCPPVGTEISFKAFLPVVSGFKPETRVEAVGQVLRVEEPRGIEGRGGFAILTQQTLLRVNDHDDELGEGSANNFKLR